MCTELLLWKCVQYSFVHWECVQYSFTVGSIQLHTHSIFGPSKSQRNINLFELNLEIIVTVYVITHHRTVNSSGRSVNRRRMQDPSYLPFPEETYHSARETNVPLAIGQSKGIMFHICEVCNEKHRQSYKCVRCAAHTKILFYLLYGQVNTSGCTET